MLGPPIAPSQGWQAYAGALYPQLDPGIDMAANLYPRGQLFDNLRHDLTTVKRIADGRRVWITETNVSRMDVGGGAPGPLHRARLPDARPARFRRGHPLSPALVSVRADRGRQLGSTGLSALTRSGTPRRMYDDIGRLHPGFRPLHGFATAHDGTAAPGGETYHFPTIEVCPYG